MTQSILQGRNVQIGIFEVLLMSNLLELQLRRTYS